MKRTKIKYAVCLLLSLMMMSQCISYKKPDMSRLKKLPDSFSGKRDSSNSASIKWNDFFKDSSLTDLIGEGLANNLDHMMALKRIEVARSNIRASKGALLPAISANLAAAQRKYGLYTMDGAGNISTFMEPGRIVPVHLPDYYAGLQTSWEVDVWGKLRAKKKAAIARYLSSVEGKNLVTTNLVAQISLYYYELLSLDSQLEIVRQTIRLQEEALLVVQAQKQAAAANELAVNQFEAQLLHSKSLELQVIQSIAETEGRLNFVLGRYPQIIKRSALELKKTTPYNVATGIPADLLSNRPDVRKAEFELRASEADVKSAKAAFYPSINITGALGYQAYNTGLLFTSPESIAYALVANLSAPLINRAAIKRDFNTASAVQQEALYNYQKTILNSYVEVYTELTRINSLKKIFELKTQEAEVMGVSIETSAELFKTGRANYMEVLMAQRNFLNARLELITTKQQQYSALVNIYKALGGGWQ